MSWGDNGVTVAHVVQDQNPSTQLGTGPVITNFNPINQVGYLRSLWLKVPYVSGTLTLAATADPVAVQAEAQYPVDRALGYFSLIAQGIAPLYQLTKGGIDLALLEYVGSGRRPHLAGRSPGSTQSNATTNTQIQGHTSDQWKYRKGIGVGSSGGATQTFNFASGYQVPLTEWVQYPGTVMQGPNGSQIPIPGQWAEVGILTAQNTQQNLRPSCTWNPFAVVSGGTYDAALLATTAVPTAGYPSITAQVWSEFYDVPSQPADQPAQFQMSFVFTRQTRDWPVSTQNCNPQFQPAGVLLRAIYLCLDANDQIVDVSGLSTDGLISFKWGQSVYKYDHETFEMNLTRNAEIYGNPVPYGALIHDFFTDHTLTEVVNTAKLASVSAEISGLPASVATVHVIEERMVPVIAG